MISNKPYLGIRIASAVTAVGRAIELKNRHLSISFENWTDTGEVGTSAD